jgi:hypothetical protein
VATPQPPRPLSETSTAANATAQIAIGVGTSALAAVETATKFNSLGTTGLVVASVLIVLPLVVSYGGVWQLYDRSRKLLMGV